MSAAKKISITVPPDELRWLEQYAKKHHRGNLSSTFAEAATLLRQRMAQEAVLTRLGRAAKVNDDEAEAIKREWQG